MIYIMDLFHFADLGGPQVIDELESRVNPGLRLRMLGHGYMLASVKNRALARDSL